MILDWGILLLGLVLAVIAALWRAAIALEGRDR